MLTGGGLGGGKGGSEAGEGSSNAGVGPGDEPRGAHLPGSCCAARHTLRACPQIGTTYFCGRRSAAAAAAITVSTAPRKQRLIFGPAGVQTAPNSGFQDIVLSFELRANTLNVYNFTRGFENASFVSLILP